MLQKTWKAGRNAERECVSVSGERQGVERTSVNHERERHVQSFKILASSRVQPGLGVKFQLWEVCVVCVREGKEGGRRDRVGMRLEISNSNQKTEGRRHVQRSCVPQLGTLGDVRRHC